VKGPPVAALSRKPIVVPEGEFRAHGAVCAHRGRPGCRTEILSGVRKRRRVRRSDPSAPQPGLGRERSPGRGQGAARPDAMLLYSIYI